MGLDVDWVWTRSETQHVVVVSRSGGDVADTMPFEVSGYPQESGMARPRHIHHLWWGSRRMGSDLELRNAELRSLETPWQARWVVGEDSPIH